MEATKEKHTTFTPGPWVISKVIKHGARCYRTIRQEGKFKLAEVFAFNECATGTKEGKAEDAANARLIAAAPEMYEAMKAILAVVNDPRPIFPGTAIGDKLREVLAKVDGGEG